MAPGCQIGVNDNFWHRDESWRHDATNRHDLPKKIAKIFDEKKMAGGEILGKMQKGRKVPGSASQINWQLYSYWRVKQLFVRSSVEGNLV